MNEHTNQRNRVVAGLILIAIAALLVLWKLEVITIPAFFSGVGFGGIVISIILVIILVHSAVNLWYTGILFPLAILGIIYAEPLQIPGALVPWTLLGVALFGSIGLHLLFPKKVNIPYHGPRKAPTPDANGDYKNEWTKEKDTEDNGYVFHSLRMGSATKYIHTNNFVGADLKSEFGELKVYFDGAQIPAGSAKINVSVAFGDMQIYVPRNWRIDTHVTTALGNASIDNRDGNGIPDGPVLEIYGDVKFGDLQIRRL